MDIFEKCYNFTKVEELRALDLDEHMRFYEDQGFSRKEAMKKVAADRGLGKSGIYRQLNGS